MMTSEQPAAVPLPDEGPRLRAAREAILAMADRQAAFAGPEYTQMTDADRRMFLHAANMLRVAADLLRKGG